jgi:hypothetical protein
MRIRSSIRESGEHRCVPAIVFFLCCITSGATAMATTRNSGVPTVLARRRQPPSRPGSCVRSPKSASRLGDRHRDQSLRSSARTTAVRLTEPLEAVGRYCCLTPDAAVRAVPPRLLLLCLLLGSSWLTVEGGRQIGAAGPLYRRRGGGAGAAVSVSVAVGAPEEQRRKPDRCQSRWL